jgi:arylformamidase
MSGIVDEIGRATQWLLDNLQRLGGDPARLYVAGHSAGGHLTAMLFATDWPAHGLVGQPIAGGVSLSGVHDLAPMVQFSYNTDLKLDDAEAARQSPVLLAPQTRAPLVLAAGADETSEFVRQTLILWDAWPQNRPAGATGPMLIPGRNHFNVVVDFGDASSELTRAALSLF